MGRTTKRTHRGFTLIELVIVITILAILAAVAIPAFQNLTTQARNAGTQGALGGLRSAIAVYRANELANGRVGSYPAISGTIFSAPSPMENGIIPENPWARVAAYPSPNGISSGAVTARTVSAPFSVGWLYDQTTGLIYANSSTNGGGAAAENSF